MDNGLFWDRMREELLGCGRSELLPKVSTGAGILGSCSTGIGDLFLGASTEAGKVFPSCHLDELETWNLPLLSSFTPSFPAPAFVGFAL